MASLALPQFASLSTALRISWPRQPFLRPLLSSPGLLPASFGWILPGIQSLLELIPPIVLAVPKKKVSHSRKSMRSANKGLKDKQNLVHCPACGTPKLAHHLCHQCYSELSRAWKAKTRQGTEPVGNGDA